jgi:hypothetical protein
VTTPRSSPVHTDHPADRPEEIGIRVGLVGSTQGRCEKQLRDGICISADGRRCLLRSHLRS